MQSPSTNPILKLPVELLSQIFEFGLPHDCRRRMYGMDEDAGYHWDRFHIQTYGRKPAGDGITRWNPERQANGGRTINDAEESTVLPWFPFTVSHVCRYWRSTALSFPLLWSVITITRSSSSWRLLRNRILAQLERSKGLAIDIRVNMRDSGNNVLAGHHVVSLFALLAIHIHRWRSIEVLTYTFEDISALSDALSNPSIPAISQLTSCVLLCNDRSEFYNMVDDPLDWYPLRFPLFNHPTPRLQNIALSGICTGWKQSWIASGSNLTSLRIRDLDEESSPPWSDIAAILRSAPRLQVLILGFKILDRAFNTNAANLATDSDALIQLLELRCLALALPPPFVGRMIAVLYAPALRELTLATNYDDMEPPRIATFSMTVPVPHAQAFSLFSCIENLRTGFFHCHTGDIKEIYRKLDNLESLECYSFGFLHPLLESTEQLGDVWLPRLRSLVIYKDVDRETLLNIRALVKQRRDANLPLVTLVLERVESSVSKKDLRWLRKHLHTFVYSFLT